MASDGPLHVQVLGPIQVSADGRPLRLGGPKQQAVLGLLVASGGRAVSTDSLIDGVWGEDPPQTARGTLQSHVSGLRSVLGEAVVWEASAYRLDVPRENVDAWRFQDEIAAARRLVNSDPASAVARLRDALLLWRGRPYSGVRESGRLEAEARRLEEMRLGAVEDRIEAELALGLHGDLIAELETLTAEHPLRERLCAQQMLALYRAGRQADALSVYTNLRETLADDLGLDPSPELRRLEQRILTQDPSLNVPTRPVSERLVFLFTDIQDSTPLWELDPDSMSEAVSRHDRIITDAVLAAGGEIVARAGDAMDATFAEVAQAASAAVEAQRALAAASWGEMEPLRVRMAIDVGEVEAREDQFYGPVLNRLGRILASGHGGQVLLSGEANAQLADAPGLATTSLGEQRFRGLGRPQEVFQLVADGLPTEFPPLRLDRPPASRGGVIGIVRGYELCELLGEGDFGAVYRAFQPSVGREVAVKVIRPEYANQPVFVRRFEAEAQFVAQLEHPHIVALYDYWREPDGAYLVMPYLRGGSLAEALRRGPWNLSPALRLLEQVGAALSYAHRNAVVHRDVKPGNVLLDEDGNAYLSDFGIAARLTDDVGGVVTSSLSYIPPEELRGEPMGPASDIFSLGVLTFELLTGTRPSGRELPVLAEARPDLPAELSDALRTATDDRPSERFDRVEDFLRAVRQAIGADVVAIAAPEPPPASTAPIRNPYKGLRAFQETDAGDFYGRETVVDELLQAMSAHRLVAVVGASGSGKSSVVRAGLVPALRAGGLPGSRSWLVADLFPGTYPFEELEAALLRVAVTDPGGLVDELRSDERGLLRVVKQILPRDDSELVLVIDQFEEVFSLVDDDATRRLLLNALSALVTDERSRVRVVLTLRADFFDRPLEYAGFADLFSAGLVLIRPPSEESLGLAISRPARGVGLELEPGLVGEIISEVQNQPGGLPLLQYALTELVQRRDGDRLTIEAYRASGGVMGALGRRAEEIYEGLPPTGREAAHQLFLRLVMVDEETDDTRRRVSQSELEGMDVEPDVLETVIQQYAAYRLLTFDRDAATRTPTVEVAHEALIREWDRLRGWVDDQRNDLIFHRRLQATMRDWLESDHDPSYLLRGGRLEEAGRWAETSGIVLSRQEEEYLAASSDQRAAEEAAARRRRWRALVSLAVALVVMSTLAVVALAQRQIAEQEARVATARALAAAALANLDVDPERSILLGLEAVEVTRAADGTVLREAEEALRRAVRTSRVTAMIPHGPGEFSDDGARLATVDPDGTITIWDTYAGTEVAHLDGRGEPEVVLAFNAELGVVVTAGPGEVHVRDVASGAYRHTLVGHEGPIRDAVLSPNGRWLASAGSDDATVRVWDLASGDEELVLHHERSELWSVAFSPDGSQLASSGSRWDEEGEAAGFARIWDLSTQTTIAMTPPIEWGLNAVAFDGAGERLATAGTGATASIWDAASGSELEELASHMAGSILTAVGFSPDGTRVAAGSSEGATWVLDAATAAPLLTLTGHTRDITAVAFTPDATRLMTTSFDGTSRVWDIGVGGARDWLTVPAAELIWVSAAFSPDSSRLAAPAEPSGTTVWDVTTGEEVITLTGYDAKLSTVAFSPDGRRLVAGSDLTLTPPVWDLDTGQLLFTLDGHEDRVRHAAFSPDGRRLVTGSWDGTARIWDAATGDELHVLELGGVVLPVAFTEDGRYIVTGGPYGEVGAWGKVTLWDAGTYEEVRVLYAHPHAVLGLALGPDGLLATASSDTTAKLWDLDSGEELITLRGHDAAVYQVAISPDGSQVATASDDRTVRLWNAATGRELLALAPHDLLVFGVAFSPDGRFLATGSPDGTVAVHLLPIDEFVELARSRVTRGLTDDECRQYLDVDVCPRR